MKRKEGRFGKERKKDGWVHYLGLARNERRLVFVRFGKERETVG